MAFCLAACKYQVDKTSTKEVFQILIADTTGNRRAYSDISNFDHCRGIARQLNLKDITKGADSIEIRAWYSFSFSHTEELYILKGIDTNWTISYYRIYNRQYDYDNDRGKDWNPYTQPIIDSSESKTIYINTRNWKDSLSKLKLDSIWKIPSQSEIKMPKNIGFTDCDSYRIEIADRHKYKFMYYHCPNAYESKLNDHSQLLFLDYYYRISSLARQYNSYIPYKFE